MPTSFSMIKSSSSDNGVYRFDGCSLIADVDEHFAINGTVITSMTFAENAGVLQIEFSDGSSISITNFISIQDINIEALNKRGPNGPNAYDGRDGKAGKNGKDGERGERGEQGVIGLRGDTGDIGPDGDYGPDGDQGKVGINGFMGERGERGEQGKLGMMGKDGAVGISNIILSGQEPSADHYVGITNPIWIK